MHGRITRIRASHATRHDHNGDGAGRASFPKALLTGRPGVRRTRQRTVCAIPRRPLSFATLATVALATLVAISAPARAATTVIEDSSIGTGSNQVSYTGTWTACGGCVPSTPNASFRYSTAGGAIATIHFSGTQITAFGIKEAAGGFAAFSVDGAPATTVDTYATTSVVSALFTSAALTDGAHTLTINNLQMHNMASKAYVVGFDRAEVSTTPVPPPPPTPTATVIEDTSIGTGNNQVAYTGTWTACGGCVPNSPNNSFHYSVAGGAVATIRFTGTQINIYGIKEPTGGFANISIDGGMNNPVDTYAAASITTLFYSSPVLTLGSHTATITNIHQKNVSASAFVVGFDRAEVVAPTTTPPPFSGDRSGKPWLSGTNGDPVQTPTDVDAFCNWRGAPCDFALVYIAQDNWGAIENPSYILSPFVGWPGRMIIGVPPFPVGVNGSNATCATGAYDSHFKALGRTLSSFGRQSSFLRIAWEPNGNWFPWSGTNPTDYINCYRHIVDAIRSTSQPSPVMCWCVNAHGSQNPPSHRWQDLYPGNNWVDGVGVDSYDHYPPSPTQADFDAQANGPDGINTIYNFAVAHNKFLGVGEWGVVSGSGSNGGGDNPNFIQFMWNWFQQHAGKGLAYEFYFNNCDPGNVESNLYRPVSPSCVIRNTASAQRYQQLWRRTS